MTDLVHYNEAKRALAAAHAIDEVKNIRDKALAMQVYGQQAKDYTMINLATEIRLRAEIKAGEMLKEMAKRGERQKSGDASGGNGSTKEPLPPKLADLGITKKQSHNWQKIAAQPKAEQEATIKAAMRSPDKKPRKPPKRPDIDKALDVVLPKLANGEGINRAEVAAQIGTGEHPVQLATAIAQERIRIINGLDLDEPIANKAVRKQVEAFRQRLQAKMDLHFKKREQEFETILEARLREIVDEDLMPVYRKEDKQLREILDAVRKGCFTPAEYKELLACLHPDLVEGPTFKATKARLFAKVSGTTIKMALLRPEDAPLPPTAMPRNYADLMATRERVRAERSAAAKKRHANKVAK